MNTPRMRLKHAAGWFAAGREVAEAMGLLSGNMSYRSPRFEQLPGLPATPQPPTQTPTMFVGWLVVVVTPRLSRIAR
jgi:hypothetical protein